MKKVSLVLLFVFGLTSNVYSQDTIKENKTKSLSEFLNKIGDKESGGNYNSVSKRGYLGKYQFHPSTLNTIGVNVGRKTFLKNKELQDSSMVKLMNYNRSFLKSEITNHSGKKIKGKEISESGILAAAHLVGAGNVRKFFKYGKDFMDGNGVKLTTYLMKFSGYLIK